MEHIDLRSDTVTKPTPGMREAMARAKVGDDVYDEDPTINRLQEMAAELLGKEAALFVPSGTMGNLSALLAHCNRGDEIILGNKSHTFLLEAGGASALGGIAVFPVSNSFDGTLSLEDIEAAVRHDDAHFPRTTLVALENTHNRCGGTAVSAEYTNSLAEFTSRKNLRLHLDGARIFNAAIALGVDVADLTAPADSVTFCLSKGLSAPVGSLLCGNHDFISRAYRARKQLGGGMRQAGILAAAGIVALTEMVERLADDHQRAARLAAGIAQTEMEVVPAAIRTNMVFVDLPAEAKMTVPELAGAAKAQGLLISVTSDRRFRMVTHNDVGDAEIDQALQILRELQII